MPRRAGGVNRPRNAAPTLSRRASRPFPGPGRHPALRTHFLCGLQGDGVARSLWQRGRGRGAWSFRRRVGPHGYGRRGTENLRPGPGARVTRLSIARALHALTCVITSAVTLPTGVGGRAASAPGREGRVGGSARCPGRHRASPRRHGFNKRRLGDTRPGRERFWARFRGFREELTLARNTCLRALLHAPGSEPPGISLRVQRFRDVRSHKQQDREDGRATLREVPGRVTRGPTVAASAPRPARPPLQEQRQPV